MEKLKLHTPDLVSQNVDKIAELFPACITEARDEEGNLTRAIDFDQLRQELSDHVIDGPRERYHLDWPGKREATLAANAPIAKTLRPYREESLDFDTTKHLFIEGDNLDALKLLQETYLNAVKLIYIDPPYNTGKDFVYRDDFREDVQSYLSRSQQKDGDGNRLIVNTESNGRFHSDWLSMIFPRLTLAKHLLSDDGAILVSVADHEIHNLRLVMDQIFGRDNFIAAIIWHKMDSPKNTAIHFSEDHDYILVYSKNANIWRPNGLERTEGMIARYKNPDSDPRGVWLLSDLAARNYYAQGRYPITTHSGRVIAGPPAGSYWRVSREKFDELEKDNRIWWGEDGDNRPGIKRFLSEVKAGVVPQTYWSWKVVGSTRNAKQELSELIGASSGEDLFITPKPTKLLMRILDLGTSASGDDIVLDFFAGSGTMGHAVLAANAKDGGRRRFILVQFPEPTGSAKYPTIADLAKDRMRHAGRKIKADTQLTAPELDIGFRVLKVDTSSTKDVYHNPEESKQGELGLQVDNLKHDRTPEDLLFQVLVDCGVDFALPITRENIAGRIVFFVDTDALSACFDADLTEDLVIEIAKRRPLRAVFRDSGYSNDSMKINVEQIFKLLAPSTQIRSI